MHAFRRILYLGWLGHGNLGDELLFHMFKDLVLRRMAERGSPVVADIDGWQAIPHYRQSVAHHDLVVLGGGSIFHLPYWLQLCAEAQQLGIPTMSWGTALDALSTESITLPREVLALLGRVVTRMQYLSVRGPYTRQLLERVILPHQTIHEIGDPALNYTPVAVRDESPPGRRIFVNWGTSDNNILGSNEAALEDALVEALQRLVESGYSLVIAPVWVQDIEACRRLANRFHAGHVRLTGEVIAEERLYALIRSCRFTITLKLHGGILSAAAQRPFISLAYRFKCIEFAASVNHQELCIPTDRTDSAAILQRAQLIEQHYPEFVARLARARQACSEPLARCTDWICDTLEAMP